MRRPSSFKLNPIIEREIKFGSSSGSSMPTIDSSATNNILFRLDGQSNAQGASFGYVDAGFTEVTPSCRLIQGGQATTTTYNDPKQPVIINQTLNDGDPITLNSTNLIFSVPDYYCMIAQLGQLANDNLTSIQDVFLHPGAIGGTHVGDHVGDDTYGKIAAGAYINRGGLIYCKNRAELYQWENEEPGGVEPTFDLKAYIFWQGETEFLELARGNLTEAQIDTRRDALHDYLESSGVYSNYDVFLEIQPVYWGGYFDTTTQQDWDDAYDYVKSSFKTKAEAQANTHWVDIDTIYNTSTYKITTGSNLNNELHLSPQGYYDVADLCWDKVFVS